MAASSQAQADKLLPPAEMAKHDLLEIERQIGRANLDCDYKYFAWIEAQEFTFIGSDGSVTTRNQDLAGESTCKKSSSSYEVDEGTVLLEDNTAVVTGRVTIRKAPPERSIVSRSRFTDVFVYRNSRWQLVAGHSSRIKDTPPAS